MAERAIQTRALFLAAILFTSGVSPVQAGITVKTYLESPAEMRVAYTAGIADGLRGFAMKCPGEPRNAAIRAQAEALMHTFPDDEAGAVFFVALAELGCTPTADAREHLKTLMRPGAPASSRRPPLP